MIVERFTIPIKPGKMDEALSMIKDDQIFASFAKRRRILSPYLSPRDVVVVDLDFEDVDEHDKLWGEIFAKEAWTAWQAKWDEIRAGQSTNHVWILE
jgi:hypothetical protein